ncbi:hypothetical protein FPV67DRAFT_1474157 [Lyophyllum atratum]|nr:hypothetical protein FPV67DRAFT_1474157 [Lyophyllum atratum]
MGEIGVLYEPLAPQIITRSVHSPAHFSSQLKNLLTHIYTPTFIPQVMTIILAPITIILALLQVAHQYLSSVTIRNKVGKAAIGSMAKRTTYSWSLREWKLRIWYTPVDIRVAEALRIMKANHISPTPQLSSFRWSLNSDRDTRARMSPRKATWCNMMNDLGVDCTSQSCSESVDAETIADSLDAPLTFIPTSDIIQFGFLLDMEVTTFTAAERSLHMTGRYCSITSQYQQGVGMIARYSGLPSNMMPSASKCTPTELSTLLRTACGDIHIGNAAVAMHRVGYNAVDHILRSAFDQTRSDKWQEVHTLDIMGHLDVDNSARWAGRWKSPFVPVVPFLLCIAGNPAVSNAFPHRSLSDWSRNERSAASRIAFELLEASVGFSEAPSNIFRVMHDRNLDIVTTDDIKVANDWGDENGGLRGWFCTGFTEFTVRMSMCWVVRAMGDRVPILPQLSGALLAGELDASWAQQYKMNLGHEDRGPGWEMSVGSVLWIQIMMLDTWISRHVECIMGEPLNADLSIPVDTAAALRCAALRDNQTSNRGWKRSRIRLVEGWKGRGASCLTTAERHLLNDGWIDMPVGRAEDWANVDAALTLRASMKDSTVLLDPQTLDQMIQLA